MKNMLAGIREVIQGDPGVRRVAGDPAVSAELLLLLRIILADGKIETSEIDAFRRICRETFGIENESFDAVVAYLRDFGYETTGVQAIGVFRDLDFERRKSLARHMAEIAKADAELAAGEIRVLRRALEVLDIDPAELVGKPEG